MAWVFIDLIPPRFKNRGVFVIVIDATTVPFPFWGSGFREAFGC